MLRITVELIPHGIGTPKRIGVMDIYNDGKSEDPKRGNYGVRVYRKDADPNPMLSGSVARKGRVENYPRLSYSVWRLVLRALRSAFPEEK